MNETLNSVLKAATSLPDDTQERLGKEWLQDIRLAQSERSLEVGGSVAARDAFDRVKAQIKSANDI